MTRKAQSTQEYDPAGMRLDKWLWCARFFKTRSLAATAIRTGKVYIGDERSKPAKTIDIGAELRIRRGPFEYRIRVMALSHQRLSAAGAQKLYVEDRESITARERLAEQLKSEATSLPRTRGRPSKRERRQLLRFRRRAKD